MTQTEQFVTENGWAEVVGQRSVPEEVSGTDTTCNQGMYLSRGSHCPSADLSLPDILLYGC